MSSLGSRLAASSSIMTPPTVDCDVTSITPSILSLRQVLCGPLARRPLAQPAIGWAMAFVRLASLDHALLEL